MTLASRQVLLLDFQTTGASPAHGCILEAAWSTVTAEQSLPIEIHSTLVRQPDDAGLPPHIQMLTGISAADMEQAQSTEELQSQLRSAIELLGENPLCVIHYSRFEEPFLKLLLAECWERLNPSILCTYQVGRALFPNLPSKGIRALAGYFGTGCGELKRAASHVRATHSIWCGLVPLLASEQQISDCDALHDWLATRPKTKRQAYQYPLERSKRLQLPDKPGVYKMLSKTGQILYVGKATSLKSRVNSYFRGQRGKDPKTRELLSQVWDIAVTICQTALEAALLETDEIKRHDPPYNRALKKRQRQLAFYSHDFSSVSSIQDEIHCIGPFPNLRALDPLLKLNASIASTSFIPDIFYGELPTILLDEGFQLFCINEGLEKDQLRSARSLMALALLLYRRARRIEASSPGAPIDDTVSDTTISSEDPTEGGEIQTPTTHTASPDANAMLTAEEISEKYCRMLERIGKAYVRAKVLTKLLNARLRYKQGEQERTLFVANGTISDALPAVAEPLPSTSWRDHDVETYDRMSVLLTQLFSPDVLLMQVT